MKRREFIAVLGAAALPLGARAQQSSTKKRIAVIRVGSVAEPRKGGSTVVRAFNEEMERLGYTEGENLIVERHSTINVQDRPEGYTDLAREVVGTQPDVIVCYGIPMARGLKAATSTIPIVALTADPIPSLISSLSHPGGNITGVSVDAGVEIWGKRLELLSEAVPKLVNVAFVSTQRGWDGSGGQSVREAAQKLGISLAKAILNGPYDEAEYRRVLGSIQRGQVDGIYLSDEFQHFRYRLLVVQLIQQMRIPAIYSYREQAEAGGLMAYSYDVDSAVRRQVMQVVEILRGANPGDMPYFQATRFELVINLKTARELGLEIPDGLVAGAAAVIE
jgi:putative tryptophan/tyrosine transport system substrate-binding protein